MFLAHRHASNAAHDSCPDPAAHQGPTRADQDAATLRRAINLLRLDVDDAEGRLSEALRTGGYWSLTTGSLIDKNWKKHQEFLSGQPGFHEVYGDLDAAFRQIARVNTVRAQRAIMGGGVRAQDRLSEAHSAVERAKKSLAAHLGPPDPVASSIRRVFALRIRSVGIGIYRHKDE